MIYFRTDFGTFLALLLFIQIFKQQTRFIVLVVHFAMDFIFSVLYWSGIANSEISNMSRSYTWKIQYLATGVNVEVLLKLIFLSCLEFLYWVKVTGISRE